MDNYKELNLTAQERAEFLEEVLTREHCLGHYAYEYTNDRNNGVGSFLDTYKVDQIKTQIGLLYHLLTEQQ